MKQKQCSTKYNKYGYKDVDKTCRNHFLKNNQNPKFAQPWDRFCLRGVEGYAIIIDLIKKTRLYV